MSWCRNFRASVGPSLFAELETKSLEINIWSDYHQPSTIAALSAPGMINCSRWPGLSLNSVVKPHRISFSPRLADEVERREAQPGDEWSAGILHPSKGWTEKAEKMLTNGQHMRRCVLHIQDIRPCVEKGRFPFRFQQDRTKGRKNESNSAITNDYLHIYRFFLLFPSLWATCVTAFDAKFRSRTNHINLLQIFMIPQISRCRRSSAKPDFYDFVLVATRAIWL